MINFNKRFMLKSGLLEPQCLTTSPSTDFKRSRLEVSHCAFSPLDCRDSNGNRNCLFFRRTNSSEIAKRPSQALDTRISFASSSSSQNS